MTGNPRYAWDSYRRLVESYAEIVSGLPAGPIERVLADYLRRQGIAVASALDVAALKTVTRSFLDLYQSLKGEPFPQDPFAQLTGAVEGILRSWESPRATEYRRLHTLDDEAGTAVTIQVMVLDKTYAGALRSHGFRTQIVPKLPLIEAIDQGKLAVQRAWFDAERCDPGLEALSHYRWDFNDRLNVFKSLPLHDWSSHAADAWRYLALSLKAGQQKPQALKYDLRGYV